MRARGSAENQPGHHTLMRSPFRKGVVHDAQRFHGHIPDLGFSVDLGVYGCHVDVH